MFAFKRDFWLDFSDVIRLMRWISYEVWMIFTIFIPWWLQNNLFPSTEHRVEHHLRRFRVMLLQFHRTCMALRFSSTARWQRIRGGPRSHWYLPGFLLDIVFAILPFDIRSTYPAYWLHPYFISFTIFASLWIRKSVASVNFFILPYLFKYRVDWLMQLLAVVLEKFDRNLMLPATLLFLVQ